MVPDMEESKKTDKVSNSFSKINSLSKTELEELIKKRQRMEKEEAFHVLDQAKKYIVQLKFEEAINLLQQVIDRFPQEAVFHSYLGLAMQRKGWIGYAQACFKVALHYDPQEQIALQFYGKPEDNFMQFAEPEDNIRYFFGIN